MKNIAILGATGSIGDSTLSVVDLHPDKFNVFALSAHTNWQKMQVLCEKYHPNIKNSRPMKTIGVAAKSPSNLSNIPPCPGRILPLSFTPASRL
jgi:1-deoxy-D-xylulose 5-phosphate reductoisomerase